MTSETVTDNMKPEFDQELQDIVHYVTRTNVASKEALETARYDIMDSLGCGIFALSEPECHKLLGPVVADTSVPFASRVPGTGYHLDPIKAAFDIGAMIRWVDYNDTWLAAEWGHPSDNLGGILALADHLSQRRLYQGKPPLFMRDILEWMVKAHEIQGVLALENSFNRVGLDHVVLVKVATTAVASHMLGCDDQQILNALSLAWVDGQSLRTYRHAPNTGTRKSWAAGDATSRGVQLAMMAKKGEMGYPSALSAQTWGFYDVSFGKRVFKLQRPYASYVMENILFKISYPTEFHGQTAVECAVKLHPLVIDSLGQIEKITIHTQEPAIRIISKSGPLHNSADRDHCLQYMVAIGLLYGDLTVHHYSDEIAADSRIDALRNIMEIIEESNYTADYYDPQKRAIGNAIQIHYKDGTHCEKVAIDYPVGHRRRREEGIPLLINKFDKHLKSCFPPSSAEEILQLCLDKKRFEAMPVNEFLDRWVI